MPIPLASKPAAFASFGAVPGVRWLLALALLVVPLGPISAQYIRLEDIIAGGDGSGSAPAENTGINPQDGSFTTSYYEGRVSDSDGVNPSPVPGSPYLDSVFFIGPPAGAVGVTFDQQVTQSGVKMTVNGADATGSGWNFILKNHIGGVSSPGIPVLTGAGNDNYFTTSIGLHSSMGITFDLDRLRERHGAAAVGCFTTFWGMDLCPNGRVNAYVVLSNDSAGVLAVRSQQLYTPSFGEFLTLEIPAAARYLTLACGANGNDNCDHAVFARPLITPLPCPQTSLVWIWNASPSRIPPAGDTIVLTGEFLNIPIDIYVGGVNVTNAHRFSSETVTFVPPPLAPGFHDLLIVDSIAEKNFVLPNAIEVAPSPELTAFLPGEVLEDRPTPVSILGRNLRSDMVVRVDDVGFDGVSLPIDGIGLISDAQMIGWTPRSENGLNPAHRFTPDVLLYDQGRLHVFPGLVTYVGTGIEKLEPSTVSTDGGTEVTFFGAGFSAGMSFAIGGLPVSSVVVLDPGHARGTTPPLSAGFYDVQLLSSVGSLIFTRQNAAQAAPSGPLAISSVSPARVYSLGGADVSVHTTQATPDGAVPRVAGIPFVNVGRFDGFGLHGEIPALAPGRYDVDLVDASETVIAVKPGAIEVVANAQITITSVTPSIVSTLGGSQVTVNGTGFSPGFEARLGGVPLEDVEILGTTQLRGITPLLDEGLHDASIASMNLTLTTLAGAVTALPPAVPEGMYIGHVRPARITRGTSRVRFVGAQLAGDIIPRIGGLPLSELTYPSPCRIEGKAPDLFPGSYVADLFRPGFGVVSRFDELVEISDPGASPRPTYLVSEPVRREGSERLFVFGNDFSSNTLITIGDKPLVDPLFVSDELIVGRAPPLDAGDSVGLRDIVATDPRGTSRLLNGLRYIDPESEGVFLRADANASGRVDLSDALYVLGYLFLGNPSHIACLDAADMDGNGAVALTDAIYVLQYLFLGGRAPPAPFPGCGAAPTSRLGCQNFASCGVGGVGGGGGAPSFYNNVKLLEEAPASSSDARVLEIAIEEGEIVVHDPPGGKDVDVGDVIAGFTPVHSDAIHNGVAYMLKIEQIIAGDCLGASDDDKVFRVRPARLGEIIAEGDVNFRQSDFFGGKTTRMRDSVSKVLKCDYLGGGGGRGAGGAEQGSGGSGVFFDVDFGAFEMLNLHDGDNYLKAGFYQSQVRYNSGVNMGVGFKPTKLTRLTFFAGLLLESNVEFYVDAGLFTKFNKEVELFHLDKGTVVFVGPFPILLTASTSLFAGVNLDAGVTLYLDAGTSASYKAGLGFEFDGTSVKNISGFEEPTIEAIPDTPVFNVDGYASVKGYIRPEVKLFGGLLFKVLTGDIHMVSEVFGRAHVEGHSSPPCFQWGFDAGAKVTLSPRVELFGFKVFSGTMNLINSEWDDLLGGEIGCKYPPVVKLKIRTESVANGLLIHLDASGSYDPDGGPLKFKWDFYDNGECVRYTGADPRTTFRFIPALSSPCLQERCTHVIRLRVTDDEHTYTERTTSFETVGEQSQISRATALLPTQ